MKQGSVFRFWSFMRQPAARLAGFYLAIILTISLFFSISLYTVSSIELERGSQRQMRALEPFFDILPGRGQGLYEQRQQIVADAKERLVLRLVFINILISVGAGFLSYYLALRTIKPIEDAHAAQSRFTSDASHELRTPIAAMRLENELALSDATLSIKDAKAVMGSTIEELDRLSALLHYLLAIAREGVDPSLFTHKIAVSTIIDTVALRLSVLAQQKHITVHHDLPMTLYVKGNESILTEVFMALLDNAIKYSPERSEVHVTARQKAQDVFVAITDQGIGIAKKDIPHIFDRFYRADEARSRHAQGGYGLGLAIAKHAVLQHGGDISVRSVIGKGTTFTVRLPMP